MLPASSSPKRSAGASLPPRTSPSARSPSGSRIDGSKRRRWSANRKHLISTPPDRPSGHPPCLFMSPLCTITEPNKGHLAATGADEYLMLTRKRDCAGRQGGREDWRACSAAPYSPPHPQPPNAMQMGPRKSQQLWRWVGVGCGRQVQGLHSLPSSLTLPES